MLSHDHANYQARLDFVRNLLNDRFSLGDELDISLMTPSAVLNNYWDGTFQPGTVAIPKGTKDLVVRLGNRDTEGVHQATPIHCSSDLWDAFVQRGVPAQFESLSDKDDKVVVHCDFSPTNILFAKASGRITALIDYDFSWISHPSYEFLRSLDGLGGQFRGWSSDEESQEAALRDAKLHGFPVSLPSTTESDSGVDWVVAKAWEEALEAEGVKRPRTMEGIDRVADVDTILCAILPWRVNNADILARQTEEVIIECRNNNEEHLDKLLTRLGF
ncbi:hypothetical protein QC763_0017870 [Podospora pseudopauciseta]|uniref:Aminoglycoside phosphotransferase domain-containing protein n=1 Tax=Podospora pseudopauciseta TaxID=2093780 RepID=A0ABR0I0D3_9PEZI|nr:hypothetical protein QC763_0017870 [Podospora pseudopauciseta]